MNWTRPVPGSLSSLIGTSTRLDSRTTQNPNEPAEAAEPDEQGESWSTCDFSVNGLFDGQKLFFLGFLVSKPSSLSQRL